MRSVISKLPQSSFSLSSVNLSNNAVHSDDKSCYCATMTVNVLKPSFQLAFLDALWNDSGGKQTNRYAFQEKVKERTQMNEIEKQPKNKECSLEMALCVLQARWEAMLHVGTCWRKTVMMSHLMCSARDACAREEANGKRGISDVPSGGMVLIKKKSLANLSDHSKWWEVRTIGIMGRDSNRSGSLPAPTEQM